MKVDWATEKKNECFLGIDLEIAGHRLVINPSAKPIQLKKRHHGHEWLITIKVEVEKLLKVGFIEEVLHTTWLVNVVMVKNANDSWRMCVDFIDLNKACLKDSYPCLTLTTW